MTLESSLSKVVFTGNNSTRIFPFTFKVWTTSQIQVFLSTNTEDETDVTSAVNIVLSDTGGTVTFSSAPRTGDRIAIIRSMPFRQEDEYITGTRFDPHEIEDALDLACAERQQLKEAVDRAVLAPATAEGGGKVYAQEIFDARDSALASKNAAAASASAAASSAMSAANSATQAGNILTQTQAAGTTAVNNINAAGTTQTNRVVSAGDTQEARVNQAGATQKTAVDNAGAAQIQAINSTATAQMEDIIEECTLQYQRIHVAGELQTERIVDYAEREILRAEAQADRAASQAQIAQVAANEITSLAITVEATDTEPGVALLDRDHNILRIQVPKGADGATPTFVQGTTTTTETGTLANVSLRTVSTNTYALDFSIPRGATGAAGRDGERGPAGPSGDISTALDAQFIAFDIDATGNLILHYTGTALEPTYSITPEGYLEVTL